jgi:hypothetical protein
MRPASLSTGLPQRTTPSLLNDGRKPRDTAGIALANHWLLITRWAVATNHLEPVREVTGRPARTLAQWPLTTLRFGVRADDAGAQPPRW